MVNGGKPAPWMPCSTIPPCRPISFVGSTPGGQVRIYARASANGKRVQCQGGAKNHVVVLPDADPRVNHADHRRFSAYGCAGQRCLAVSVAVTVGEAQRLVHANPSRDTAANIEALASASKPAYRWGPSSPPPAATASRQLIESGYVGEGARPTSSTGATSKVKRLPQRQRSSAPPCSTASPPTSSLERNRDLRTRAQPGPRARTWMRRWI